VDASFRGAGVNSADVTVVAVAVDELATFYRVAGVLAAWISVITHFGPITATLSRVAGINCTGVSVVLTLEVGVGPTVVGKGVNGCARVERARIVVRTWIDVQARAGFAIAVVLCTHEAIVTIFVNVREGARCGVTNIVCALVAIVGAVLAVLTAGAVVADEVRLARIGGAKVAVIALHGVVLAAGEDEASVLGAAVAVVAVRLGGTALSRPWVACDVCAFVSVFGASDLARAGSVLGAAYLDGA
jgi:hypothetical protein